MIKMAKMAQIDQKMTEIWPKVVKMAQNTQKVERAQIWEKMYLAIFRKNSDWQSVRFWQITKMKA